MTTASRPPHQSWSHERIKPNIGTLEPLCSAPAGWRWLRWWGRLEMGGADKAQGRDLGAQGRIVPPLLPCLLATAQFSGHKVETNPSHFFKAHS